MSPVTGEGGRWICFVVSWWPPSPPPALCPCRCSPRSCSAGPSSAWGSPWWRRGGTSRIQTSRDPRRGLPRDFRHFDRCGALAHFQTHVSAPEIFFSKFQIFLSTSNNSSLPWRCRIPSWTGCWRWWRPCCRGTPRTADPPGSRGWCGRGTGCRPHSTLDTAGIRNRTVGAFWRTFVHDILEGIYDIILIAANLCTTL